MSKPVYTRLPVAEVEAPLLLFVPLLFVLFVRLPLLLVVPPPPSPPLLFVPLLFVVLLLTMVSA